MEELSSIPHAANSSVRQLDLRAVARGIGVGAGGGLILSTFIGVAAVLGMAGQGLSAPTIVGQLRSQWDIRAFLAAAELLTAVLGGYTAGVTAGRIQFRHALIAGVGTLAFNLLVIAVCGTPLPTWLAVASLTLVIPCATLGGYLASPCVCEPVTRAADERR